MKVALCQIAWNECDVIGRSIRSCKDIIDLAIVVIDSRTTDNTAEEAQKACDELGIQCIIEVKDWVDFSTNRNYVFDIARDNDVDFGIILDADEVIVADKFDKLSLDADGYNNVVEYGGQTFMSIRIVNLRKPWKWNDVIHNYLSCEGLNGCADLPQVKIFHYHDGYRSKIPDKIVKDIEILKKAVEDNPEYARYWFYYAQTLRENGQLDEAIVAYKQRLSLQGWDEETWYSMFMVGFIYIAKNDFDQALIWMTKAYQFRPARIEPLYHLSVFCRNNNYRHLAYIYSRMCIETPKPNDYLFIEDEVYNYLSLLEYGISLYWVGKFEEAKNVNDYLMNMDLPESVLNQIKKNNEYCIKMCKKGSVNSHSKKDTLKLYDNPLSYFDKVFLIHDETNEERHNNCLAEFKKIGLVYEEVDVVYIANEQGGLGNKLSHRKCVEIAKINGYKDILILEDDFKFEDNWKHNVASALLELPPSYNMLYLGGNVYGDIVQYSPHLCETNGIYVTHALVLNENIYDLILASVSDDSNQSYTLYVDAYDRFLQEKIRPLQGAFVLSTFTVGNYDCKSTVDDNTDASVDEIMRLSYLMHQPKFIYYNDAMSTFGDAYVSMYDFKRVRLEEADVNGLLWFGVYTEQEYDKLISIKSKINMHWCGSDTLFCLADKSRIEALAQKDNICFTVENKLQYNELKGHLKDLTIAPMYAGPMEMQLLEKGNYVLVYTPDRRQLYNVDLMFTIAKEMPHINFIFIGKKHEEDLPNVKQLGWVDQDTVNNLVSRANIYLRITEHDGFSDLMVKAFLCNTHVITNWDYFGVKTLKRKEDIEDAINYYMELPVDDYVAEFYGNRTNLNNWDAILKYKHNDC